MEVVMSAESSVTCTVLVWELLGHKFWTNIFVKDKRPFLVYKYYCF